LRLRGFPHFADLLNLIRDFALDLERVLREDHVLLVACDEDGDLLGNDLDVSEQVVDYLGSLPELSLFLGV